MAHHARAASHREEFRLEADQPARGNAVIEPHAARVVAGRVRLHVDQLAAARTERFHRLPLVRLFHVHGQHLVGLAAHAVDLADHDLRARHRELVAFAAHVLEQDREMQLAAARHEEHVGVRGFLDAQRHVAHRLAQQPLAQLAAGDELSLASGERRSVHLERHVERRLVDLQQRQRFRMLRVGERHADADLLDAVDEHDVARLRLFREHTLQALEHQHLVDLRDHRIAGSSPGPRSTATGWPGRMRPRLTRPMPILPT
jgi:hypothetical protein